MRPGEEGRVKLRERSLGKVSVVQIARAVVSQESWVEERLAWAVGILERILEIGNLSESAFCIDLKDRGGRRTAVQ